MDAFAIVESSRKILSFFCNAHVIQIDGILSLFGTFFVFFFFFLGKRTCNRNLSVILHAIHTTFRALHKS